MIIIAESGATKTDWVGIGKDGTEVSARTEGMNVATMSADKVLGAFHEALPHFSGRKVTAIHFYGAGVIDGARNEIQDTLRKEMLEAFPGAEIEFASDLLDAARALLGHEPGIATIMGTGSNSCFYDGRAIFPKVRSGGFILGDEGGAARLGLMFISDFIKGLVPAAPAEDFASKYDSDYMTIVREVYKNGAPARYLGSFAPWILSWYGKDDYMSALPEKNFRDFIERALIKYDYRNYPVGAVGGFVWANRDIFAAVAKEYGITLSRILPAPMEGLIEYHKNEL